MLEEYDPSLQLLATINAALAIQGLMLKTGTVVDATLIAEAYSTKNSAGRHDPEMHQTKEGNQWHFGMKAHIWVDFQSGLVHTVIGAAANVNDAIRGHGLLHAKEADIFADTGYEDAMTPPEATGVAWHVAMRPVKRRALDPSRGSHRLIEQLDHIKISIRVKVGHQVWGTTREFGFMKARYWGLAESTAQLITIFTLSNFRITRKRILQGVQA